MSYRSDLILSLEALTEALRGAGDDVLEAFRPSLDALNAIAAGIAEAIDYVEETPSG